jgi:hypothetical protein
MYRILHTERSKGWGGQETRIIQESPEFMKRGYRMMIACQPGSGIQKAARDNRIPVIALPMRAAVDPLAIPGCTRAIKKISIQRPVLREECLPERTKIFSRPRSFPGTSTCSPCRRSGSTGGCCSSRCKGFFSLSPPSTPGAVPSSPPLPGTASTGDSIWMAVSWRSLL